EGGCGCCVVTATYKHPATEEVVSVPVNSCLCPVYSAVGWHVTTIEGIGGSGKPYHPIQERLAEHYGTQCGFCSPGFVMSMYSQLQENAKPTMQQVEHFFDGNICRCTGYRSILDGMKSFACDSNNGDCVDIEEMNKSLCAEGIAKPPTSGVIPIARGWKGQRFYNPGSLDQLLKLLKRYKDDEYQLVCGNTSAGVFKEDVLVNCYINVRNVPELHNIRLSKSGLEIGATVTLRELIDTFKEAAEKVTRLAHLDRISDHYQQVANQAVRANASWAGNLMMKHRHQDFPSDVFITLEAAKTVIKVADEQGTQDHVLTDFLRLDMRGKVIVSAKLPAISTDQHFYRSFKITPRQLNHAIKTENFLLNKSLLDEEVVQSALKVLESEVVPVEEATASSPEHRRQLAVNLLYKTILDIGSDAVEGAARSGGPVLTRPLQRSEQDFVEELQPAPLGQSVRKLESKAQTSGEATYVNDYPAHANELFLAYVLAPEAAIKVTGFDTEEAETDEIFPSKLVGFAGQPVAVVLAETQWAADRAASLVDVKFDAGDEEPIVHITEALAKKSIHFKDAQRASKEDADATLAKQPVRVEGEVTVGEQIHFFIESLTASVRRTEEGFLVQAPHQWIEGVTVMLSKVLRRPRNQIRAISPRIGGGFGGKMFMVDHVIAVCAIACDITHRPCRMYLRLDTFALSGQKRPTIVAKYKAGADTDGVLRSVHWDSAVEAGYACNFITLIGREMDDSLDQAYHADTFKRDLTYMKSNKPQATAVRAPGSAPAAMLNLLMMDHMAHELRMDPIEFKRKNLYRAGQVDQHGMERADNNLGRMWDDLYKEADIEKRRSAIEKFNKENHYKKRGLDMSAISYHISYARFGPSEVDMTVHMDGSISIVHSGSEMGQGLTTKVAQAAVAQLAEFGATLDMVKTKPTDSMLLPQMDGTGGSATSELNAMAAKVAAEQIRERLLPIKENKPDAGWNELVMTAIMSGVLLKAFGTYVSQNRENKHARYSTLGVGAAEVEVDILTGEYVVLRSDIMMDIGKSLNPGVDIGQIEGAYVFGMGYYLTERTVYDSDTGRNLADGTWNYKPPQAADVPRDFRVHLLKKPGDTDSVFSTKAIGEPPLGLAATCVTAIKRAIEAFRKQQGKPDVNLTFELPLTPARVLQLCEVGAKDRQFKMFNEIRAIFNMSDIDNMSFGFERISLAEVQALLDNLSNAPPATDYNEDEQRLNEMIASDVPEATKKKDCNPETSLNDFLRDVLNLKGTKVMCREGGCGCCVVTATYKHPATEEVVSVPVNSCLCPVYSAVGWHVTTIEGIGGSGKPYHPIQERLAEHYGTQCGFCSPGFVMSMYSQLQENPKPTMQQVEHFFDGNICRCTGYRSILDGMKSFACDSNNGDCVDI
uniref:FAD-binding PCMH-type domain-containing protein n=1 Tax=Macrostomum lignano TaxID=282301 RepID=A0A1I8HHR4_9PLAT